VERDPIYVRNVGKPSSTPHTYITMSEKLTVERYPIYVVNVGKSSMLPHTYVDM
jgi:hypothetical protein